MVDELLALGCTAATATLAGVNAQGDSVDAQRAVLWSRLASRVLWPLAEFDCADEQALYAGVTALPWTGHIGPDSSIAVDAHVSGPVLTHARYAAQRVKDAVVDVLRDATGARPDVDLVAPDVRLNLLVRRGRAQLAIDLGGGPLHRRGYRCAQGDAPLKETLAVAVLMRGGWPKVHAAGGALLDPMCGSGTLLIEGALIAADVAPGLLRHGDDAPTRWLQFDDTNWTELRGDARRRAERGRARLRQVFHGGDADPRAIAAAAENARAAGIGEALRLQVADIASYHIDPSAQQDGKPGLAVCNPPYDQRLAADLDLYRALGDALRREVPQWRASLLCGDAELARATGLRAGRTYQLFNGALECLLIVCDPVAPALREPSTPAPLSEGSRMVANRLRRNLRVLKSWRAREVVTCYRAYDADLPEYAAAIDVYTEDDSAAATPPRTLLHVQEYAAPAEIPEADVRRRRGELLAAARDVFGVDAAAIALKTRERGPGGSRYAQLASGAASAPMLVREGAARLRVDLFGHLDTGLFLDHRPLRARMAAEARGHSFLNLFCYTGAATVQAAVGGASTTTSVDLSGTYLQWLADNLVSNGCGGAQHRLVQADVMAWLGAERGRYDVIFCDPPTFSNSARAQDFDVQRDHVPLLRAAVGRLSSVGVLYFSNNFRRFRLDAEAIAEFATCEDISASTIPPDFSRTPNIHRCWRLRPR